ncbi:hypothetical protein Tco_1315881 [Tanacetum coccineum]
MSKASDDIQERELHQLQLMQENAKESCMTSFRLLHSFLVLSYDESKSMRVSERAFMTLFGQDNETFTSMMSLNLDQLQRQLDKDEFHEDKSMAAFWMRGQSQMEHITSAVQGLISPSLWMQISDRWMYFDQVKSPLLKAEFLKTNDMVEKEVYNELSNRFLQLEKHCISLEISMQQKEESFQSNKPCKNQESPEFREFFEINDLKAQLQAKTTLICNLKNQIKSVKEASNEPKVKHDIDVLKTINIELESSVAKLLAENEKINKENEHLTQTYKDLYDSIKKTRI